MTFKTQYTFECRCMESQRLLLKYPNRIPIICGPLNNNDINNPVIDKTKYLAPNDLTIGQFYNIIRKRMKLAPEKAIFLFINNNIYNSSHILSQIYDLEKDDDGFLYIVYAFENTFG